MTRLKGLDEFEPPEFIGRMARVERHRRLGWWALIVGGFVAGVALGVAMLRN
jgi:hypothetical protein